MLSQLVLSLAIAAGPIWAEVVAPQTAFLSSGWTTEPIAEGIVLRQRHYRHLYGGPQFVSVLELQLRHPTLRVRFAAALPSEQAAVPLNELAEKIGAVAAVNGGFMPGDPHLNVGIVKVERRLLPFLARDSQPTLGFAGSGAVGVDRYGTVHFRIRNGDAWEDDWPSVDHALAGGHMLLLNGCLNPRLSRIPDHVDEGAHANRRHPRTAVAVTGHHLLLLVTVDGRHPGEATGMSLAEFAEYLRGLGCCQALNLDGGGSTTMWTQSAGIVNHPCDNRQFDAEGARPIRTAVVIVRGA